MFYGHDDVSSPIDKPVVGGPALSQSVRKKSSAAMIFPPVYREFNHFFSLPCRVVPAAASSEWG